MNRKSNAAVGCLVVGFCILVVVVIVSMKAWQHVRHIAWTNVVHPKVENLIEDFVKSARTLPDSLPESSLRVGSALRLLATEEQCPKDYKAGLLDLADAADSINDATKSMPKDSVEKIAYSLISGLTDTFAGEAKQKELELHVMGPAKSAIDSFQKEFSELDGIASRYLKVSDNKSK
jgi:hypothetical protein